VVSHLKGVVIGVVTVMLAPLCSAVSRVFMDVLEVCC
jgi:hypothetical protein